MLVIKGLVSRSQNELEARNKPRSVACSFRYKFRVLNHFQGGVEVKLTYPTTPGERAHFRKEKLLFGEVTVLTLIRS